MFNWLKRLWSRMLRIFKSFIDVALPIVAQVLIAELKDFAINTVGTLQSTNLSNEEKRRQAFEEIKAEAINRGKNLSDSLINVLIELALQYIKNSLQ